MGTKTKFGAPKDYSLRNFSGWSGMDCRTCGKRTTNAELSYSTRFFKKPLCRSCQKLEEYTVAAKAQSSD